MASALSLLWSVTHYNSYLWSGSFPQSVSISSFCSAFRKENVWLLIFGIPVSSLGVVLSNGFMHIWAAHQCLYSIGLLWLREGGGKPGVPIKHGLKASSWYLISEEKHDLSVLHICSWCKFQWQKISLGGVKTPHCLVLCESLWLDAN